MKKSNDSGSRGNLETLWRTSNPRSKRYRATESLVEENTGVVPKQELREKKEIQIRKLFLKDSLIFYFIRYKYKITYTITYVLIRTRRDLFNYDMDSSSMHLYENKCHLHFSSYSLYFTMFLNPKIR